jgi:FixJ family two-component response regulator
MESDVGGETDGPRLSQYEAQVFLLDDEQEINAASEFFLEQHGAKVSSFTKADSFLDEVAEYSGPGCVLLDMKMPGTNGLLVQNEISRVAPQLVVVFLTGRATYSSCAEAMRLGAHDILQKPLMGPEFIDQMASYLKEADQRWQALKDKVDFLERYNTLTTREREVYFLLLDGNQTKQVAFQLNISVSTAEKHVRNVLRKFHVDSSVRLILASVRCGDLVEAQASVAEQMPAPEFNRLRRFGM